MSTLGVLWIPQNVYFVHFGDGESDCRCLHDHNYHEAGALQFVTAIGNLAADNTDTRSAAVVRLVYAARGEGSLSSDS